MNRCHVANCKRDAIDGPLCEEHQKLIGMSQTTERAPAPAEMKYPGPGDPFNGLRPTEPEPIDWLAGSTSSAGRRDEMVKRHGGHVCREDLEAAEPRPRCATCGQFVAFRPLEHGPDAWQAKAIERIRRERLRQDAKWGEQNHGPDRWSLILTEETGEVAKAALERDHKAYIAELVQVAAVALAALECAARGAGAEGA